MAVAAATTARDNQSIRPRRVSDLVTSSLHFGTLHELRPAQAVACGSECCKQQDAADIDGWQRKTTASPGACCNGLTQALGNCGHYYAKPKSLMVKSLRFGARLWMLA